MLVYIIVLKRHIYVLFVSVDKGCLKRIRHKYEVGSSKYNFYTFRNVFVWKSSRDSQNNSSGSTAAPGWKLFGRLGLKTVEQDAAVNVVCLLTRFVQHEMYHEALNIFFRPLVCFCDIFLQ
jgi:hypothetical protein